LHLGGSNSTTGDDSHGTVKLRVNFVAMCASCPNRGH